MTASLATGDPEAQHAAAVPPFTDATATPEPGVAEDFLTLLDDSAENFTFQTFDDAPAKRPGLARVLHGTIEKLGPVLTSLNDAGAGIFVMVNVGDGRGRKTENVTGVRAVFADFDGTPLPESWPLEPHIVVESSPGRFHAYWIASGVELGEFKRLQEAIAARFGSDPSVNDLPRVMRLPGFIHRKGVPFRSRIVRECPAQPYMRDQLVAAFGLRVNGHGHAARNEGHVPRHDQGALVRQENPGRPAQLASIALRLCAKEEGGLDRGHRGRAARREPCPLRPAARRSRGARNSARQGRNRSRRIRARRSRPQVQQVRPAPAEHRKRRHGAHRARGLARDDLLR